MTKILQLTMASMLLFGASSASPQPIRIEPVTDAMLAEPDPADWLMWRRTADSWGYSPLDQISKGNVGELELVWSMDLDDAPSQEGIPLVYDGILFFPGPMDVTYALNAADGGKIWEFRRTLPEDLGSFVPFPATNRNLAIYDKLIIDNGADGTIYALHAETGALAWETKILDYRTLSTKQGSGPLVAGGKLISGRNCTPQAGPDACIITAHDALTGRELWRRRTIPRPGEPGSESWGDTTDEQRWHVGAWMIPSYDPELDIVYIGTSVTAPAPKFMIAGNDLKYLFHNSTLALDPNDGSLRWHYQHLVDHWDLDHPFERILLDTIVAPDADAVPWINPRLRPGERRKVVTGIPGKTGIIYTLDRETGELLWARPTIEQNVVSKIDAATGAVEVNPETLFTGPDQQVFVCPTTNGGKNWPAGAYSPRTGMMYFPMANTCMRTTSIADKATPEMVYAIRNESMITPGTTDVGTIQAYSAASGTMAWRYDQRTGVTALLATGGDLIFGGDVAGRFRALDAVDGTVLWETALGSHVTGHPVSFAVNGRQFIAVSTGGSNLTGALARYTRSDAATDNENKLFVFALPSE